MKLLGQASEGSVPFSALASAPLQPRFYTVVRLSDRAPEFVHAIRSAQARVLGAIIRTASPA